MSVFVHKISSKAKFEESGPKQTSNDKYMTIGQSFSVLMQKNVVKSLRRKQNNSNNISIVANEKAITDFVNRCTPTVSLAAERENELSQSNLRPKSRQSSLSEYKNFGLRINVRKASDQSLKQPEKPQFHVSLKPGAFRSSHKQRDLELQRKTVIDNVVKLPHKSFRELPIVAVNRKAMEHRMARIIRNTTDFMNGIKNSNLLGINAAVKAKQSESLIKRIKKERLREVQKKLMLLSPNSHSNQNFMYSKQQSKNSQKREQQETNVPRTDFFMPIQFDFCDFYSKFENEREVTQYMESLVGKPNLMRNEQIQSQFSQEAVVLETSVQNSIVQETEQEFSDVHMPEQIQIQEIEKQSEQRPIGPKYRNRLAIFMPTSNFRLGAGGSLLANEYPTNSLNFDLYSDDVQATMWSKWERKRNIKQSGQSSRLKAIVSAYDFAKLKESDRSHRNADQKIDISGNFQSQFFNETQNNEVPNLVKSKDSNALRSVHNKPAFQLKNYSRWMVFVENLLRTPQITNQTDVNEAGNESDFLLSKRISKFTAIKTLTSVDIVKRMLLNLKFDLMRDNQD